jgi:tRNA threonylcarbamoyladenosine biosynthesis protein TsaB
VIILAIDVTTDSGGLALLRDGELFAERTLQSSTGYGQILFGALDEFLRSASVAIRDIDYFASASGPGTFTGIRVGLAAAKGMAEATGKGALGISNLRALAYYGTAVERTAVLDARRGELYWATYDSHLQLIGSEQVGREPEVSQQLVTQKADLLSTDKPVIIAPSHLASAVGHCAFGDVASGKSADPLLLDANYIRRNDANNAWLDRPEATSKT